MADIQAWADQLTEAVHQRWLQNGQLPLAGYRLFYAPVRLQPDLLIIGVNPGGGEADFLPEHRHTAPREGHAYLDDRGRLAKRMRDLGAALGNDDVVGSVALNINFFRTQNAVEWENVPNRRALETFCQNMLGDIVAKLQPKAILAFGLGTFDTLLARGAHPVVHLQRQTRRLVVSSTQGHPTILRGFDGTIFGMTHPTSTRGLAKDVWATMLCTLAHVIKGDGIQ